MYKIELKPTYKYTISPKQQNWTENIRDHVRPTYYTDEMIEWIFENINGKIIQDGKYLYFVNDQDALAFKLRWL